LIIRKIRDSIIIIIILKLTVYILARIKKFQHIS
jgi:hypothetical protein